MKRESGEPSRQSVKRWESRNIWTYTSTRPPASCPNPSFLFVCYLLNHFTKVAGNSNSSPSILKRAPNPTWLYSSVCWASYAPKSWEGARKSGPWKAPIGHAAAIKWGHVAPWTCLAAWLGLPAHFLQGPLPCRVYNQCAKVSLLCTETVPSKAMCYIFLWQLMCALRPLFSENASVSLWPYPMPAIILFAVYENMLSMQCLFSVYLRGQRNTFEGFKPRLPSAAVRIYVGQNIHCRFWGENRIQFHI